MPIKRFTREEIPDALVAAKERATAQYLKAEPRTVVAAFAAHPAPQHNVVGVGIGSKVVKGRATTRHAIRFYVDIRPLTSLERDEDRSIGPSSDLAFQKELQAVLKADADPLQVQCGYNPSVHLGRGRRRGAMQQCAVITADNIATILCRSQEGAGDARLAEHRQQADPTLDLGGTWSAV